MAECTIVQSLVYDRLRINAFSKFHRSLREFGMKAMDFIEEQVPGQTRREFVTAAIVSCREIEMEDLKCIIDANNKLNILQTTNKKVKVHDYFLLFKRVVVILNLPSPKIHGECRLFDPHCRIRREICEIDNPSEFKQTNNINFLNKMKHNFFQICGQWEKYVICVFTFFIPCTIPGHMCSKVLCEFATQNNEQLILSYSEVHNLTNPKIAWSDMKTCKNVYCMHSKDMHFIAVVDIPLTDINETIEAWLFDDDDYPECSRLVRRHAKRTSKRKLYRKCKEKHNTWEIYRNRIMEELYFI